MSQLLPPVPPSLPQPPAAYEPGYHARFAHILRLYFAQVTNSLQQVLLGFNHYGTFYDTTTQTAALPNTAYNVHFNTVAEQFGITVTGSPDTRITITREGVYMFQFSAQLNSASGTHTAFFWLRKNGEDVPFTTAEITLVRTNDHKALSWQYVVSMPAGGYIELMWSTTNVAVYMEGNPPTAPHPGVPSIVGTMTYLYPGDVV